MRPRLALVSALLLALTACGGDADGGLDAADSAPTATASVAEGSSPSVRIEIGDAEPVATPDEPVASAIVVTTVDGDGNSGDGPSTPASSQGEQTDSSGTTVGGTSPPSSTTPSTTTSAPPGTGSLPPGTPRTSVVAQAVVPTLTARVAPEDDAPPVVDLDHPTAVGSPLVFLVTDTAAPVGWLEVQLPVQPNGTTGWVRREDVDLFENPYRIEIDRSRHRLAVFHFGQPWLETTIAVGTGATPTPVGDFYLLELLAPPDPTGPYGPYAFGLSGFSEVLDSFGGADTAIIGLHGTDQPAALGTDVSFGCVRLANDVMEQLATTLPLGTPVRIT